MKLRLPHPFVLLLGAVAVAALLTWTIPAGEYQRRKDEATGREVVIAGTYALAVLLFAGVSYGCWLRFAITGALLVALVGSIGIILAAEPSAIELSQQVLRSRRLASVALS